MVIWCPGHSKPHAALGMGIDGTLAVFGIATAHVLAREAAGWHPAAASDVSLARTRAFAEHLGISYARLLEWALVAPDRMPEATPLEAVFRQTRPPKLPVHAFADDDDGHVRCVRCLLPPPLASCRPCRPHRSLGHIHFRIGSGFFCGRCGAYSFKRLDHLGASCTGPPLANGPTAWRLRKMHEGRHPQNGVWIGRPVQVNPALEMYTVVLGEPTASTSEARH